jgi:hypothetical protein
MTPINELFLMAENPKTPLYIGSDSFDSILEEKLAIRDVKIFKFYKM